MNEILMGFVSEVNLSSSFFIKVIQYGDSSMDKGIIIYSTMERKNHSFKKPRTEKVFDLSKQTDFLFNKTPILASALKRLKDNSPRTPSASKAHHQRSSSLAELELSSQPNKKVKKSPESAVPSFAYTPLQKDLFNFYTINKVSLKMMESVPEPKFEVGSTVLVAICDRGIGGKYLVASLFRNKKGYIDYREVSQSKSGKDDFSGIEAYQEAGDFVVCSVVKSISNNHLQLSISKFLDLDPKCFRVGQVLPAEIQSKQELGCHLIVHKCPKYKFFLAKSSLDDSVFEELSERKQIIVTISDVDHSKHLVKVKLAAEEANGLNLRGVQEEEMNKLELEQYVAPGTLLNTKIIKVLRNGVMVKFLKIFIGFIHADHLSNNLDYYANDAKIEARIIYSCLNPPFIFLSQRHVNLHTYKPKLPLYSPVAKPALVESQNSYINKDEQFFVHPSQLHSEIENVNKFWVKENNYFQRYQIMTSRKIGLRVGEVAKEIPFNNFKVFGEGEEGNKFKVMCLDVWNKVVKISYDEKVLKSNNMLMDLEEVKEGEDKMYCGVIKSINENGVNIQFCNNIRGIIPKHELKLQGLQIDSTSLGKGIDVYLTHIKHKRNYASLSLVPPSMRKAKGEKKESQEAEGEETMSGTIVSVDQKSINPIYVKLKSKMVKISIFNGIKPAALGNLPIIRDLASQFEAGQQVRVFRKAKEYFLYPPEQLSDKALRICRVVGQKGAFLRLQVAKNEFKNCHISDVTDMILPYPFAEVNIGEYVIGRLLPNGAICLRNSVVMNGIPKNMVDCKEKYSEQELRGDYRNRILTVGSAGLKEDMVLFGYVKSFTEKGCFISITNDFDVRVQISELTDQYIPDKAKHYPLNRLMLVRLISEKVKQNDPTKRFFDASGRESVVKMGYPLNEEALMTGLTVSGCVTGYTKGKALLRLDGSRFTGIMNPHEVEGLNEEEPIEKSMKLGSHYKMKIIEYANEGRRLIRLSTLPKYFKKYPGVELGFEQDPRVINLWNNYLQMLQEEPPLAHPLEEALDAESEDQYDRIKALLAEQEGEAMDEEEQPVMQEEDAGEQQDEEEQEEEEENEEFDEGSDMDQEIADVQEDEEMGEGPQAQIQPTTSTLPHEEVQKRLAQFRQMNQSPQLYQTIVLANDSSESHIQYISAMVSSPDVTPDQIREQFVKSIAMLESIKDKENMWVAWLNMELILGDFMGVVKRAIDSGVGLPIYGRIIEILREQDNWDIAFEMSRKMLKKFNKEIKAYHLMMRHMILEELHNNGKQRMTLKELLRRASQCLKAKDLITIESQYSKILYEEKEAEKARTVFENILTAHPKRTDLWSMYVDLEVKHGSLDKAREILERSLTLSLKKKKMVSILKKYYQIEEVHGDKKSAAEILERAKRIAADYAEGGEDQDSHSEEA